LLGGHVLDDVDLFLRGLDLGLRGADLALDLGDLSVEFVDRDLQLGDVAVEAVDLALERLLSTELSSMRSWSSLSSWLFSSISSSGPARDATGGTTRVSKRVPASATRRSFTWSNLFSSAR